MPIYIELPIQKTTSKLTDWLEINALLDADGSVSAQDLRYNLDKEEEAEDDQIEETTLDQIVSQVFAEIDKRQRATKDKYPFRIVNGDKIVKKPGYVKFLPYIFCLLISYFGPEKKEYSSDWKTGKMSKKFEELSANAIRALLTSKKWKVKIRIFGYPRKWKGQSTNPRFSNALQSICDECGEMRSKGRVNASNAKDGGLDIIAWKRFPDQLQGCIVFAGQCAIGKDWKQKKYDVKDFFDWFVDDATMNIRGIFIPHIPDVDTRENKEEWMRITTMGGIIFNRCRISFLSENWRDDSIKKLYKNVLREIKIQSRKLFV